MHETQSMAIHIDTFTAATMYANALAVASVDANDATASEMLRLASLIRGCLASGGDALVLIRLVRSDNAHLCLVSEMALIDAIYKEPRGTTFDDAVGTMNGVVSGEIRVRVVGNDVGVAISVLVVVGGPYKLASGWVFQMYDGATGGPIGGHTTTAIETTWPTVVGEITDVMAWRDAMDSVARYALAVELRRDSRAIRR